MTIKPQNLPEQLIWYYITGNYIIYFLGAQFILSPLLAWFLLGYLIVKWWWQDENTPESERIKISTPAWISVGAVFFVAIAHLIGSLNFEIDLYTIIRDFINNWIKMWSLLAIFPLIGHLQVRPQLISRAICIFCAQSIFFVILFWLIAFVVKGQSITYVSPLYILGGLSSFYTVKIGSDLDLTEWRLQMIAPWAPALGLIASIYFFLALQESNKLWRYLGLVGALMMAVSTSSRTAIVSIPIIYLVGFLISNSKNPKMFFGVGTLTFVAALIADQVFTLVQDFLSDLRGFRSGSSNARDQLKTLAFNAWKDEAPIWGHGSFIEIGNPLAGTHNIGSHHTFYGVLYQYGLVAGIPLALSFIWTFFDLFQKIRTSTYAKTGIEIMCILMLFIGTENLEATAYLYWPGLVVLGTIFNED